MTARVPGSRLSNGDTPTPAGATRAHREAYWPPAWGRDLPASVVVFLVALPLCLGIALASGAPLLSGLITGIVGGLVVSVLSGSQLMVSGPAAGLTAIVLAAITSLGSFERFLVAVMVGGALQVLLGVLRAGIIGYYFPSAVIQGMLAAIGLILILKQVPHALGYDLTAMGEERFWEREHENTFSALVASFTHVHPGAAVIGVTGLVFLFLWAGKLGKRFRKVPGALLVVLLGVGLNEAFRALAPGFRVEESHLVQLPRLSSLSEVVGALPRPDWSGLADAAVWRYGLTLAIVASLESLLSLEATNKLDPEKREAPANRELLAQGAGNLLAGFAGGLPMTGVIVRSSANIDANAHTRWSAFFHGLWLLLAVLLIPGLLNRIPLAALAAVLLFTGYKLAHPSLFRAAWRIGPRHALPFVITITAILFTDLLVGIAVGLAVGVTFVLLDSARVPALRREGPEGGAGGDGVLRFSLPDQVTFMHKARVTQELDALPDGARVVVDGSRSSSIDYDVVEILLAFRATARARNIDYQVVGIPNLPTTPAHH
jgi:MFS superfamily sulfate permease-like transporter